MSKGFDKLKEIGAQKIHEATHISRESIQAILHENFEDMTRVQLLGFISIFEREYSLDLSDLRNIAISYFEASDLESKNHDHLKIFLTPTKKRNLTPIYIAITVVIFVIFALINMKSLNKELSNPLDIDNSAIDSAKSSIALSIDDKNNSVVEQKVEVIEAVEVKQEQKPDNFKGDIVSLKIIPNTKVWLGYIDLSTYKKYQTTFSDEFDLDPTKDLLLVLGHGHINIEINGIVKKYKNPKTVRFLYKGSELKELTFEEFKELNRGTVW